MKSRKGVSLIELVLTIALLGLVLQVVYSVFFIGTTSYSVSTNKGFSQQDVRMVSDFIENELKTATDLGANLLYPNGYFSLEIEPDGDRNKLVKYYNWFDDKGTEDTSDDGITKDKITTFRGNWKNFTISNTESGTIDVTILQEEGFGKGKSDYLLEYDIELLNNASVIDSFEEIDLIKGDILYYRNDPIKLRVNGILVKSNNPNIGDVLRTLTFRDSIGDGTIGSPFTAKAGAPIEKPPNPTKTGYTFLGWYTIIEEEVTEFVSWDTMPDHNFTLYARWSLINETNPPVTPSVTAVSIIEIHDKNGKITTVNISENNSDRFKLEKDKNHNLIIKIKGNNLSAAKVTTNAINPFPVSNTKEEIKVNYTFTAPKAGGTEGQVDVKVISEGIELKSSIFKYITN